MRPPSPVNLISIDAAKVAALAVLFLPFFGILWHPADDSARAYLVAPTILRGILAGTGVGAFHAALCGLTLAAVVVMPFLKATRLRVPLVLLLLLGWGFELFILDINGTVSDANMLMTLWQERASGSEAFKTYAREMARNIALITGVGVVLLWTPGRFALPDRAASLPLIALCLTIWSLHWIKTLPQVLPVPFGTFANMALLSARIADQDPKAHPLSRHVAVNVGVPVNGTVTRRFDKIVFIMDESVRGDYLTINDPTKQTTPYLASLTGQTNNNAIANFGVALAGANCSSNARMMLRFGMRASDLPGGWNTGVQKPTMWEWARRAGYKTVYVDAFAGPLDFHSGFSALEKRLVDSKINVLDPRAYTRDHKAIDRIVEVLREDGPAFVYVDKYGIHTPYAEKYPPEERRIPVGAGPELADRDVMVAHYSNAMSWSVDAFFRKLLPALDLSRTLLIYTSDHGQSLLDGGYKQTHCTMGGNVHIGEALVPLFAASGDQAFAARLAANAARYRHRFSHFEIFPTLLLAMGHDAATINKLYGPSLLEAPSPDRKFLIGFPYLQPKLISEAERALAEARDTRDPARFAAFIERYGETPFGAEARRLMAARNAELPTPEPSARTTPRSAPTGEDASRPPGTAFRDCPTCPEMVVVPAGQFMLGAPAEELGRQSHEGPEQPITFAHAFAVGRFEITVAEWAACVADGGCRQQAQQAKSARRADHSRHPITWIAWEDAKAYATWLAAKTGKPYRLLSEAEWEYSARGVTTRDAPRTPFATGATISTDDANYDGNGVYGAGRKGIMRNGPVAVGSFKPNAFGLHDLHGNVWEWVEDCYRPSYFRVPPDGRPVTADPCDLRVSRGGSWYAIPSGLRSAHRESDEPDSRSETTGFRIARDL